MNDFDDLLTGALGSRGDAAATESPDVADVWRRSRHHQLLRRSVAGACVAVLAAGGVAAVALRTSDGGRPVTQAPLDDGGAPAADCAEGQILSAQGDVVLHDGVPYALTAGQCLDATEVPSGTKTGGAVCVIAGAATPDPDGVVTTVVQTAGEPGCPVPAELPCPSPGEILAAHEIGLGDGGDRSTPNVVVSCGDCSALPALPPPPDSGSAVVAPTTTSIEGAGPADPPNVVAIAVTGANAAAGGCFVVDSAGVPVTVDTTIQLPAPTTTVTTPG